MKLQERIELMCQLGVFLSENPPSLQETTQKAFLYNSWFTQEFTEKSLNAISTHFLQKSNLQLWSDAYEVCEEMAPARTGIVMAGNIPLVGFHDMLCCFIAGQPQTIKLSSKDNILIPFLLNKLEEFDKRITDYISISENLKGCDAYIATGSNNASRYFEYYFSKYPHIIRSNKTSLALLDGNETSEELDKLADDISLYFGLGCRNVTCLLVPEGYDFSNLMHAMEKYSYFREHHKYTSNYDYRLALLMLNKQTYLTNGSILITKSGSPFAPVSMLHYETYSGNPEKENPFHTNNQIQCMVGRSGIPFGKAQYPDLFDYADGVDTMAFLCSGDLRKSS